MKKITTATFVTLLSINAYSFEDFVQDIDANETNISTSFGFRSSELSMSGPGGSIKESTDTDGTSIDIGHSLSISSDSLVGFGVGIDESASEGETDRSTSIGAIYVEKETATSNAFSLSANYTVADTDNTDSASISFSKQLKSDSNPQFDGEFYASFETPISPDDFTGGNSLALALAGRLRVNDQIRLIGGAVLITTSDYEYDNGVTFSADPSVSFLFGAAYQVFNNIVVDLTYAKGGSSGVAANSVGKVDLDSDFSSVRVGLEVTL